MPSLADAFLVNRTSSILVNVKSGRELREGDVELLSKSKDYLTGLLDESYKNYVNPDEINRCVGVIDSLVEGENVNLEGMNLSLRYLISLSDNLRVEHDYKANRFYEETE